MSRKKPKAKKEKTQKTKTKTKESRLSYRVGLPKAIATKISKTTQTRGAEKDTIFQNRVSRCSTVLIPMSLWKRDFTFPEDGFKKGYIVLTTPEEYFSFSPATPKPNLRNNLNLGENLLVLYETRYQWENYPPERYGWSPANSRIAPLGGQYVARVPDTIRDDHLQIRHGYVSKKTGGQGAGIRFYEYASEKDIEATKYQLSFLAWRTEGIFEMARQEGIENPEEIKSRVDQKCCDLGLADLALLQKNRMVNRAGATVCPLCLEPIQAGELASRVEQAEGRSVPDLTVTKANLFHVEELKTGVYNHRPYNLGWGHHHCNATARDRGIERTLQWMEKVLKNNGLIT